MIYLLDTDHITLLQHGHEKVSARFRELRGETVVSMSSYEEQMRGWLALINQANKPEKVAYAYRSLEEMLRFFCGMPLVGFNPAAVAIYQSLRQLHRRQGKMDLQIAATALELEATLVTRNTQDFIDIENLRLENWA